MNLKNIVMIEVSLLILAGVGVVAFLQLAPGFQASGPANSIGVYRDFTYNKNTIIIERDGYVNIPFVYNSFDPSIIVFTVSVQSCNSPGNLTLYCNYRSVASIYLGPETPPIIFNMISFSGLDWIEAPTAMFGQNEMLFESERNTGFEGSLTYQITLRGSR